MDGLVILSLNSILSSFDHRYSPCFDVVFFFFRKATLISFTRSILFTSHSIENSCESWCLSNFLIMNQQIFLISRYHGRKASRVSMKRWLNYSSLPHQHFYEWISISTISQNSSMKKLRKFQIVFSFEKLTNFQSIRQISLYFSNRTTYDTMDINWKLNFFFY